MKRTIMPILTKNFIFIRHGSTDWNMSQVYLGPKDYSLNQKGRDEAIKTSIAITEYLYHTGRGAPIIISSALNRAKETAYIISDSNNKIPIIYDAELNERFFGDSSTGKTVGAEEEQNFKQRISSCINKILQTKYDNLIIVSHFEVFKSLQKILTEDENSNIYISKGEAVLFNYDNTHWEFKTLGETAHDN